MNQRFSRFANAYTGDTGTRQLMRDLGEAAASSRRFLMLGGGNPGPVPEMQAMFQAEMRALSGDAAGLDRTIRGYASPTGDHEFVALVTGCLRDACGWDITERNVALTNGSQNAFFILFNALAGEFEDGTRRHIQLPLTPEYLGYTDVGIDQKPLFRSTRPRIEHRDNNQIKYRIDFDSLEPGQDIGAICISRPTNPTGNVITDNEVRRLQQVARDANVPLIIDGAYGLPFPGMVFNDATPLRDDNTIVCLSLSKLGLAGLRTGIVVANEDIIEMIGSLNSILNLAPTTAGPGLTREMLRRGDLVRLSRDVIKPFYLSKAQRAIEVFADAMGDTPWRVHVPEGAFFMWTWFPDIPVHSQTLYERLKERGVLVIAGHHFFPGLEHDAWAHKGQCLRITYAQDDVSVHEGLRIIADEVKRAYG